MVVDHLKNEEFRFIIFIKRLSSIMVMQRTANSLITIQLRS
jgi:hypothetical protein